jgi:hypothetical protein
VIGSQSPQRFPDYSAAAESSAAEARPVARSTVGGEAAIRIIEPRPQAAALASFEEPGGRVSAASMPEPRRVDSEAGQNASPLKSSASPVVRAMGLETKADVRSAQSIDIIDLPETRGRSPQSIGKQPAESSGVRPASATVPVSQSVSDSLTPSKATSRQGTSFASANRYSHDPHYRWLRGSLEYSQIDKRWKLRYIPIDGTSDAYGGSVVLADDALLSGYERGDFVEVRGRIGPKPDSGDDYSPLYEVTEIKAAGS